MLEQQQLEMLWNVFEKHLLKRPKPTAASISVELVTRMDWPAQIEGLLLDHVSYEDEETAVALGLKVARQRHFDSKRQVLLVAALFERGAIDIHEALSLLSQLPIGHDEEVSIQAVLDVVWLVKQDKMDGVMDVADDDLLSSKLQQALQGHH